MHSSYIRAIVEGCSVRKKDAIVYFYTLIVLYGIALPAVLKMPVYTYNKFERTVIILRMISSRDDQDVHLSAKAKRKRKHTKVNNLS